MTPGSLQTPSLRAAGPYGAFKRFRKLNRVVRWGVGGGALPTLSTPCPSLSLREPRPGADWEGTEAATWAKGKAEEPRQEDRAPEEAPRKGASLTAVHLVRGILTVHKLVAATGVPDAGAVPAAEFARATGRL